MKNYIKTILIASIVAFVGSASADRNGSGTYTLPAGNPVNTGTPITTTWANNTLADIANNLTNSVAKDGQTVPTANLPMGGFRHTNVANATARNNYSAAGQVQDFSLQTLGSVAGSNTITGNLSPAITSYVDGMIISFRPASSNTGATTLAINGLAAQAVVKFANSALANGDLSAGDPAFLLYASNGGGRFVLLNPQSATLNNGVALSDLARLSVANTYSTGATSQAATFNATSATGPYFTLQRSGVSKADIGLGQNMGGGFTVDSLALAARAGLPIEFAAGGSTSPHFTISSAGVISLNGVASSDFARLSQANTFTSGSLEISANTAQLVLRDTAAALNEKPYAFRSALGQLNCYLLNDAGSAVSSWCTVDRTGTTVDSVAFTSTALTWNGNSLFTLANDGAGSGLDADLLDGSSSAAFATASHVHSAADVTSGTLAVARGGTGTTTSTGSGNNVLSASPTLTGTVTAATLNATTLQQGGTDLLASTTATGTVTGCTTAPTTTVRLTRVGSMVMGSIDNFSCTSNALTLTLTGAIPAGYQPARFIRACTLSVMDSGSTVSGCIEVTASSTLTLTRADGSSFNSAAVLKGLPSGKDGAFFYHLN